MESEEGDEHFNPFQTPLGLSHLLNTESKLLKNCRSKFKKKKVNLQTISLNIAFIILGTIFIELFLA